MKECNGTGLVLKICETKNNVWKRCEISIQDSIDNHIKTTKIKPNFASLNRSHKSWNPLNKRIPRLFLLLLTAITLFHIVLLLDSFSLRHRDYFS